MSRVFVDTSAVIALLHPKDDSHARARRGFDILRAREAHLATSSYVLVETYALLGRRMGPAAVRAFRNDLAPLIEIVWVDSDLHEEGLDLLLEKTRRTLSLVDAVSFVVMRRNEIEEAFAVDPHFTEAGFELIA